MIRTFKCLVVAFTFSASILGLNISTYSQNLEEESIKNVITSETQAYMDKDYEKWSSYWAKSEKVLRITVTKVEVVHERGWELIDNTWRVFFEKNPEKIKSTFVNSNYNIHIDKNLAWAAFNQLWTTETGEQSSATATITFVREDGDWKIMSYTAIQMDSSESVEDSMGRE